jgi:NADH-quinone oxidoreductase subunit M
MSALLYTVAAAYPVDFRGRARQYLAWVLFLEFVSLGLFLTLDLLLFYVFFDLSLVGMYFLIAQWGHEDAKRAAIKFILYTFMGSLIMLLGILSLFLATDPLTFDMRELISQQPLAGAGVRAGLSLFAVLAGLAIKTPLVPVHTWLPAAHVEAPAPASALLAGVLLKMGVYGMIRIAYAMMKESFVQAAWVLAVLSVIGIIYAALVALGERQIKRRIAYTSIIHMGYSVLGIAMAFSAATGGAAARQMALTGATLEMVAHGLITGSLFLLAGSLWHKTGSFSMDDQGGVLAAAPRIGVFMIIASFASLGLPAMAGFVAEFQIFAGSLAIRPWMVVVALVGVVLTAALFLQLLQSVFLGQTSGKAEGMGDLAKVETAALAVLLGLTILIGVVPSFVVNVIDSASKTLVGGLP